MLKSENIKLLVVHCSDTDNKVNFKAKDIHDMHIGFGWNGIGYHKIILRSGQIQNGRPEYWIGAHVKGKNEISLGVCLVGRDKFTNKQFISLERTLKRWKLMYPQSKIVGHYNTGETNKSCPNFDVIAWAKNKNI